MSDTSHIEETPPEPLWEDVTAACASVPQHSTMRWLVAHDTVAALASLLLSA